MQTVLIQFSMSIDFVYTVKCHNSSIYITIQFNASTDSVSKTVPFQTIQFSISVDFVYTQLHVKTVLC